MPEVGDTRLQGSSQQLADYGEKIPLAYEVAKELFNLQKVKMTLLFISVAIMSATCFA